MPSECICGAIAAKMSAVVPLVVPVHQGMLRRAATRSVDEQRPSRTCAVVADRHRSRDFPREARGHRRLIELCARINGEIL